MLRLMYGRVFVIGKRYLDNRGFSFTFETVYMPRSFDLSEALHILSEGGGLRTTKIGQRKTGQNLSQNGENIALQYEPPIWDLKGNHEILHFIYSYEIHLFRRRAPDWDGLLLLWL